MSQRQRQRKVSTAKELRVFLVPLLCILTLVQGSPLEAAEQRVRKRTLWVGEAEVLKEQCAEAKAEPPKLDTFQTKGSPFTYSRRVK